MSTPETPPRKVGPGRTVVAVINLCGITWAVWHWGVPALPSIDWWELVKGAAATVVCGPLFLLLALAAFVIAGVRR